MTVDILRKLSADECARGAGRALVVHGDDGAGTLQAQLRGRRDTDCFRRALGATGTADDAVTGATSAPARASPMMGIATLRILIMLLFSTLQSFWGKRRSPGPADAVVIGTGPRNRFQVPVAPTALDLVGVRFDRCSV